MTKIRLFILPFLLAIFVLYLSIDEQLWLIFWKTLNIPAVIPPFSDLDSITKTLLSKSYGFDVYLENPHDPTHGVYIYPSIWLSIFDFLNLNNINNFRIFNFIIILIYFFVIQDIYLRNSQNITKFILIYFSTTNFLILERLNIEIIIFSLIYFCGYF
jgi:hypothetical protein